MGDRELKGDLCRSLQRGREDLLWKLEGLSEYDIRRPVMPTGTNLLGLVKHAAYMELEYFGVVFGRPSDEAMDFDDEDLPPNADMWATAAESRDDVVGLYRRAWAHAGATIEASTLETVGSVPWWPVERREVTLSTVLVHVIADTHRHTGHADIVRELIDGSAGLRADNPNLPPPDPAWWSAYRDQLEQAAREAAAG